VKDRVQKLRLGRIPRVEAVKLTIFIPAATKQSLDQYASLHSQLYGESVDAVTLIPYMLQAFIERDRGYKSLAAKSAAKPL
jgi:hypothetical protein